MTKRGAPKEWLDNALKANTDECLEWPFFVLTKGSDKGYGKYLKQYTHRIVCKLAHGEPLPDKPFALHACHNRKCCNPKHLRWGSAKENTADMITAGRQTSW